MRLWPVLFDACPGYLRPGQDTSILLTTVWADTVGGHIREWLEPITRNAPVIVAPPRVQDQARYTAAIRARMPAARVVFDRETCVDAIGAFELSDALAMLDASCLPIAADEFAALVRQFTAEPRLAYHLVAFESGLRGTKERVNFDAAGRVRGIARHYERATWPFISGVAATVLPVACGLLSDGVLPATLGEVRQLTAARGVPSRDVPVLAGTLDLASERGLLTALEHFAQRGAVASPAPDGPVLVGTGQQLSVDARIIGQVVIHAGATVHPETTVIGPAVIGPNAVVESGAVVVHAIVGEGTTVPRGVHLRDSVCVERVAGERRSAAPVAATPYPERLARMAASPAPGAPARPAPVPRTRRLKRAFDATLAGVSLLLLSPVLACIAAAIRLDSKGPIFYGDKREGMNGRAFRCWKFRTMCVGAHDVQKDLKGQDHVDGPHFKMDRDPRVTRLGKILRASNLDELPQLFNVLIGEMSLIGPRPSPFRENQVCVPWREARLSVRPGITGLWQVCRHDRAAGDFHQWIEYDLLYVQHASVWLDIKILAATVMTGGGKIGYVPSSRLIPALAANDLHVPARRVEAREFEKIA